MEEAKSIANRDPVFDVLKGIGIIAVLAGHSGIWCAFVHTFHMPLFFFIAGYFFKQRSLREEFHLGLKRLLVPYMFVSICICSLAVAKNIFQGLDPITPAIQDHVLAHLLGYRNGAYPSWLFSEISISWFLLALFWARLSAALIANKIKCAAARCILFILLGTICPAIYSNVPVPFCIPQGLGATGFLYAGMLMRQSSCLFPAQSSRSFLAPGVIGFAVWLEFLFLSLKTFPLDLSLCRYPNGFISSILYAVTTFLCIRHFVARFFNDSFLLWRGIHFVGRFSLIAYCAHAIEYSAFWDLFYKSGALFLFPIPSFVPIAKLLLHLAFTLSATMFILKIQPLRAQIFQAAPTR